MLVRIGMRDEGADLADARGPCEQLQRMRISAVRQQLRQQLPRYRRYLAPVCIVQPVALHQVADGDLAAIRAGGPADQVVEDALAQRGVAVGHPLDLELLEDRLHDGETGAE